MPSDDLYLASPSTHTVPCSPYITHMISSSPAHVPDIDQLYTSNSRNRRTHTTTNQRPGSSRRTVIPPHLPCGTPPQLTLPESKLPNNNLTSIQKNLTDTPNSTSSQTNEQVVPNCSPVTSSQVDSEDCQSQGTFVHLPSQCSDRQTFEKNNMRFVPFDEKPAPTPEPEAKRPKRTLNSVPSPNAKHLNMFLNDEIFD